MGLTAPEAAPSADERAQARVRRVELLISTLLRVGVTVSLVIIVAGTLLSFAHHPGYVSSASELARLTTPGAAFPHTLEQVRAGLRQGRGQAVVVVGLLLLIATPVARVAVSILGFLYQRDRAFALITLAVLVLLLLSFWLGRVEG
jgi:uncharacterized membrane protein